MNLIVKEVGADLLIRVAEPRIDAASAVQFRDAMRKVTDDGHGRVVLDLAQVGFIDSSGLGAIVGAMKQLGQSRKLELASLGHVVANVFRLTHLDAVFTIHADVDAAFAGALHAQ